MKNIIYFLQYSTICVSWVPRLALLNLQNELVNALLEGKLFICRGFSVHMRRKPPACHNIYMCIAHFLNGSFFCPSRIKKNFVKVSNRIKFSLNSKLLPSSIFPCHVIHGKKVLFSF